MTNDGFRRGILLALAMIVSVGSAVFRCVQLILYTDTATGYITLGGENTVAVFYVSLTAAALLYGLYSFSKKRSECPEYFMPGKSVLWFSALSCIGMFYDFIHQCLNCYYYMSQTAHPAANRLATMIACTVFALFSCVYYAVMCEAFRSSSFDYGRLWPLRFAPVMWFLCNLLLGLTEHSDVFYDVDSVLKYFTVIAGLLFFLFLSGISENDLRRQRSLAFSGFCYGAFSFILSFPRLIALAAGTGLNAADYSEVTFLFTGMFAFALSFEISAQKRA